MKQYIHASRHGGRRDARTDVDVGAVLGKKDDLVVNVLQFFQEQSIDPPAAADRRKIQPC